MRETKRNNLDKFVKEVKNQREKLELAGRRVVDILDQMSEIFLPKDKILTSAGIIPVYYWFIRETEEDYYSKIRSFLQRFELFRKQFRTLDINAVKDIEYAEDLVQFNINTRSPDDQKNHKERLILLTEFFNRWLKTKKIIVVEDFL